MGDQEVAPRSSPAGSSIRCGQRDGRGVRGDDAARPAHGLQPLRRAPAWPRAPRRSPRRSSRTSASGREVVLEIAGGHQPGASRGHERRRLGLRASARRRRARARCGPRALRHDVEQQDRHAGIGDMRGDARCPSRRRRSRRRVVISMRVTPPRARWRCPGRRRCTCVASASACPRAAAAPPPCR